MRCLQLLKVLQMLINCHLLITFSGVGEGGHAPPRPPLLDMIAP